MKSYLGSYANIATIREQCLLLGIEYQRVVERIRLFDVHLHVFGVAEYSDGALASDQRGIDRLDLAGEEDFSVRELVFLDIIEFVLGEHRLRHVVGMFVRQGC